MFKEIQKVFVKVVTLDWHDYRCLEQAIMAYIILGFEIAYIIYLESCSRSQYIFGLNAPFVIVKARIT